MNKNDVEYLVGCNTLCRQPMPIYNDLVCNFLDELSSTLRHDAQAKLYPDIMTFAFWCRKGNIQNLKEHCAQRTYQMGRGIVFHIAPSNVPVNFAYSLAFGMLAGNGNIVRVSSEKFPQVEILCKLMDKLLQKEKYKILYRQTQVISYGHEKAKNDRYSALCDARVIWGGDRAISEIRTSPITSQCVELTFADRYSFALFDEQVIFSYTEEKMLQLAKRFFNDTYLMDQNACSSPQCIFWLNPLPEKKGRRRFWKALAKASEMYSLSEKKVMDKYTLLCENIIRFLECKAVSRYHNLLYVVDMDGILDNIDLLRGIFGLFYEMECSSTQEILPKLTAKMQTCVCEGIEKEKLAEMLIKSHVQGIDRIVETGKALDIGVHWDGYDIIKCLSREICIL